MVENDFVLAVDLGGTKVESALVHADGSLLPGSRYRRPTGREASSAELVTSVRSTVLDTLRAAEGRRLRGVGIASAGPVVIPDGTVSPLNLPAWREFPLRQFVADVAGLEHTLLRLDGFCVALAETWMGELRAARTGLSIVVSTGVGGGLLVDGKLVGGRSGNAGHIGQVLVPHSGGADSHPLTLEEIAAGPNVVTWAKEQGWMGATGEELAESVAVSDPIALAAVSRCATALGDAIASVSALLDLECVTLGGGFANVSDDLVTQVRQRVAAVAPLPSVRDVRIVRSALGADGPLQGAAGLIHRPDLLP